MALIMLLLLLNAFIWVSSLPTESSTPACSEPLCRNNDIDECQSNPCLNGGICNDEVGRYSCQCLEGFGGERCEEYCVGNFNCENFGSCQYDNRSSSLYCDCLPGYIGNRCEIEKDFCLEQPCPEGSLCITRLNGFLCKCTSSSDDDCEDSPEPPDVCAPGHHFCPENACVPLFKLYYCNCPVNDLNTDYCGSVLISAEVTKDFVPTPEPPIGGFEISWWFIAIGAWIVLLVVFFFVIIFTRCSRKRGVQKS